MRGSLPEQLQPLRRDAKLLAHLLDEGRLPLLVLRLRWLPELVAVRAADMNRHRRRFRAGGFR